MARRPKTEQESPTAYAVPTLTEARALHAWSKGQATEEQQKVSFHWIIRRACRAGDEVLVPGQPDVSAYLAGKRGVSLNIGWVLGQPADAFRQGEID